MTYLTEKEIDWYINHPPSGNWRQFCKIRVDCAIMVKKWSYKSNILINKFFVAFEMAKTLMNLWSMKRSYHSFMVLPLAVKVEFSNLTAKNCNPKVMPLDVPYKGMK